MASSADRGQAPVQPWEKQDGEPDAAFEAFKGYLLQAPPRRLVHSSVKHGTGELSSLYNEWRWGDRVLAYDRHCEATVLAEREALLKQDARERMADQIRMLRGVEDILNREIAKLLRDSKNTEAYGLVKVSDLNKLLANAITLRRLIHGESTENVQNVDADLSKLTVEELREMQRLQAKLYGEDETPETTH